MAELPQFSTHVDRKSFEFHSWMIETQKSHILQSRCTTPAVCQTVSDGASINESICDFCLYEKELDLPQLPEMTFANNGLLLKQTNGFGIRFNALEALKLVDSKNDTMKVAVAEAWQESRSEDLKLKEVVKPFDWTYTTAYRGTLFGDERLYKVNTTEERINMDRLKERTKILFYDEAVLFEDELADNGTAHYSVKIRVMPDGFFVLLRYFLRVDNLLVRIIDTRIYYEVGKNYLLREHTRKESKIKDLKVDLDLLRNPQELWNYLPTVNFTYDKVEF